MTSETETYATDKDASGLTAVPPVEAIASPGGAVAELKAVKSPKVFGPLAEPALERIVRRQDEDRWLASRFAPKALRQRLTALYAFNLEVARVADKVSEPHLGEIRLQWWRDAVESTFAGGVTPAHPVMKALAELRNQVALPLEPFDALLTARVCDLSHAPFETWADVDAYIDATDGGMMRLATLICQPAQEISKQRAAALHAAARAWGYMRLLRDLPQWTAQQRTFFPRALRANISFGAEAAEMENGGLAIAAHAMLDRAAGAQKNFGRFASALDKELFPAIGYIKLTPLYMREQSRIELGQVGKRITLLQRQLRLVMSAASSRF